MQIVDTNIILRYMLEDHEEHSPAARKIIDENDVEVPIEVLCEVVFVLHKVYSIERKKISAELLDFFANTGCNMHHKDAVLYGIKIFANNKLDFVDCILAGYKQIYDYKIYTFDKKLNKIMEL